MIIISAYTILIVIDVH